MLNNLPKKVTIVEVGPRDGLQNEEIFVSTENKIEFINKLSESGISKIEITSFVHPKWTPQLSDSLEVAKRIKRKSNVEYTALLPNLKGLEKAIDSGLKEVAVFMSSSESHNKKNLNRTISESLKNIEEVVNVAKKNNINVRAYLSTVFGCPYEGYINFNSVKEIVLKLLDLGVYQVSLGDTIGIANPKQVRDFLNVLFEDIKEKNKLALHFHDTRGMALANSLIGLDMGITTFDSSLGGLGGCPYAPGATGNVATEDLVNMLHSMGIETGINLDKLVEINRFMEKVLGRVLPSKYSKTINATKRTNLN
ncbi:MAG: hydroxymethylglutaryl-CoA lyase YngG [Candidatus Sericytochromatia bacterium]|nr:MAG: hydroxymethylglutaryl-CoA lyase YngG [Candidatus Sericytochromatia bacterium]